MFTAHYRCCLRLGRYVLTLLYTCRDWAWASLCLQVPSRTYLPHPCPCSKGMGEEDKFVIIYDLHALVPHECTLTSLLTSLLTNQRWWRTNRSKLLTSLLTNLRFRLVYLPPCPPYGGHGGTWSSALALWASSTSTSLNRRFVRRFVTPSAVQIVDL